jgi:hypothetical protein
MTKLRVRNSFGDEFEIDASARPFWEHREGHQILPGEEPAVPADAAPAESGDPKPSTKAAHRPASGVKEQVVE